MDIPETPAVAVENIVKSYGAQVVVNGFTMTVPERTIYGLLGPSGCGKTTVIGCIVGICGMESGNIRLSIKDRLQLGYMPQDSGLFDELTAEETFYYQGRINMMTDDAIANRITVLSKLLNLPETSVFVKNISGGQKRRVSFAVALLHNPQLLLLDEPTVGLDPELRYNIWEYLRHIVAVEGKTVLLTTHYIEEVRQANTVGFMLDGVLLDEGPPDTIMSNNGCNTLEDTFLILTVRKTKKQLVESTKKKKKGLIQSPLMKSASFSPKRLSAQIRKNVTWLKRSYLLTFYLGIILPMVAQLFTLECIGKNPAGLHLATVNAGGHTPCHTQTMGCNMSLGCRLVQNLRSKSYKVIEMNSEAAGVEAVTRNRAWGVMAFPLNFTESIIELYNGGVNANENLIDFGLFNLSMDMSNSIISFHIYRDIRNSFYDVVGDHFVDCGWNSWSTHVPIRMNEPIFGKNEVEFTTYVLLGVYILFPFLFAMLFSMSTILLEKTSGVIERSLVSGLLWYEFLIAHIVVVMVLIVFTVISQYIVVYCIYKEVHRGQFLLSFLIAYLQGLCGMCCGILIAAVCTLESVASQTLVTMVLVCCYATGGWWPVEGMHWLARVFSFFLPTTVPLESLRHVIDRGLDITSIHVFKGFAFSILWIIIILSIASHILYRKTRQLK